MEELKQRYMLELAYNGTRFHGWQVQPNAVTVQETLETALSLLCREPVQLTGAGRTDTGVHASFYVAHFDAANPQLDQPAFCGKLNSYLSKDLVIFRISKVHSGFHARYDAIARTYRYYIATRKDPFRQETAYHFNRPLDIEQMNDACSQLFLYSDFTSFSRLHTDVKNNLCSIYEAQWNRDDSGLIFTIRANRFLRNMVRAIVGTLIEVGLGKLSPEDFRTIIERRDRSAAGVSAPAKGLFLCGIEYSPENTGKTTG